MRKTLLLFLVSIAIPLFGQGPSNPTILTVSANPAGSCGGALPWRYNHINGTGWFCGGVSGGTGTWTQIGSSGSGGPPTGSAGGDLGGSYPNPTVVQINGAAVPASTYVGVNASHQIITATTPLLPTNNLSDVGTAATALSNLGGAPLASPTLTGTATFGPTSNYYWQIASDASFPIIKMFSPSPTNTLLADIAGTSSGQVFVDYAGGSGGSFNIRTRTSSSGRVTALTIDSSGNATFAAGLTLSGIVNAATGDYLCYNAGVIEFNTATCTLSLRKYKQNIHALSTSLTEVMALKPVEYRYRPEMKLGDKMQIGFIADDVAKLDPRIAVYKNNGELESVDYEHMTALLAAAIQEQQSEILSLKKQIAKMKTNR